MRRGDLADSRVRNSEHAIRIVLLMGCSAALYLAIAARGEVSSSEALGAVRAAERFVATGGVTAGRLGEVPSPHALAIVAVHRVVGGHGPSSWERAAQIVSVLAAILLSVPVYLVALELYEARTAWLGSVLFLGSPMVGYIVANLLGDVLFLLFWTWGLWAAIRFLRDGRWVWLPLFVCASVLATSLRLDGALLAVFFWVIVGIMPWKWAAPVKRTSWWPAFMVLTAVLVVLVVVPGVAGKIARSPSSWWSTSAEPAPGADSQGLSNRPSSPRETAWEFTRRSVIRMLKVTRNAVSIRLLPLAVLGLILAWSGAAQARVWLFLSFLLVGSIGLLIERRASLGDCALRDALVPAFLLLLAAGHGLGWLVHRVRVEGVWFGRPNTVYEPGGLFWAGLLMFVVIVPNFRTVVPPDSRGGFASYRAAASWMRGRGIERAQVIDLTGWTTFEMPLEERSQPATAQMPAKRWVVARQGHVLSHSPERDALVELLGDDGPRALFPATPSVEGVQVRVFEVPPERALRLARRDVALVEKKRDSAGLRLILDEKPSNVKH